ncbi:MAG: hypothetical protein AB7D41_03600 [Arcobacter sp.]|uniref:hypothetical protein n=1 Tax=Arcobacter sp. TaxID=1872629 RepID=UPI003D049209
MVRFIKSNQKDNGIFKYKLKTSWEIMVYRIFCLARRSNGFGAEIEYQVVKDFCKKENLNYIEFFAFLKSLNAKVS